MRALDRYILKELAPLFLGCFGLFAVAFTAVDSVSQVTKRVAALGVPTFLQYLSFRALAFQNYVFPVAFLLALLLCYSRMAREGEVLGLEVSGVSRIRMAWPALFLAVVVALSSFLLEEVASNAASQQCALILTRAENAGGLVFKGISNEPEILSDGRERMLIAHSLDLSSGTLNGVFLHFFFEGRRVSEVYADKAVWENPGWRLEGVRKLDFGNDQSRANETVIEELRSASDLLGGLPEPKSLLLGKRGLQTFLSLRRRLASLTGKEPGVRSERRLLRLELQQRLALPASTLVLALAALAIGLRRQRQEFGFCLGVTVMVALAYYLCSSFAVSLSEGGHLSPFLGAWSPNLILGVIAGIFFNKNLR